MKKAIITGAGGFIGSALTRKLLENGVDVVAISRHFSSDFPTNSSTDSSMKSSIKKFEIEISEEQDLLNVIPHDKHSEYDEYDAFYHLVWKGVNGKDKADPIVQIENIRTTLNCASVAKKLGCKKFLCSGTIAEQAVNSLSELKKTNQGMLYAVAKHCAHLLLETYCKAVGQYFIWMQFSNVYGPKNKTGNLVSYTIEELLAGREATFGPALQPYDFIFIDDLIEAVYTLGVKENKEIKKNFYYIGSGQARILKDYLLEIGKILCKPELVKIGIRPNDGISYTEDMFDISSLVSEIGNYNKTTFTDGIKLTLDGFDGF